MEPHSPIDHPVPVRRVSPNDGHYFFGYYDKSPWSPDGSRLLMHRQTKNRDPHVEIALLSEPDSTWRPLGESHAWNYQQGSMTQWLPRSDGNMLLFNDIARDHPRLALHPVRRRPCQRSRPAATAASSSPMTSR